MQNNQNPMQDYKEKIEKEFDERWQGKGANTIRILGEIKQFLLSKLDEQRQEIVEGWKEPNRLAYERGKADGMEEEAIGCFDHSQKDLSDYKKGLAKFINENATEQYFAHTSNLFINVDRLQRYLIQK